MQVMALTRYVRISPWKCRDLAQEIQGRTATDALNIVTFSSRKGAFYIGKTLKSAIANAEHNAGLSADELVVQSAVVDEGPHIKRWMPRARGSASPILKRTSHIRIVLTDTKSTGK